MLDSFWGNFLQTETYHFRPVSELGRILWADPSARQRHLADTISTLALAGDEWGRLDDAHQIAAFENRSFQFLLSLSERLGPAAHADELNRPFFRLPPDERLCLLALHRLGWTYARLSRLLDISRKVLEQKIWAARSHLSVGLDLSLAIGGKQVTPSCPFYETSVPWTQRFLDEELTPPEFQFLSRHMMGCDACRQTLERTRKIYYAVEGVLPLDTEGEQTSRYLKNLWTEARGWIHPTTFSQSLKVYFRQKETQILVAALGAVLLWGLLH